MAKCVFSTFNYFKDIVKDTFLLAKMILATGGLAGIFFPQNALSKFVVQVINHEHVFTATIERNGTLQWPR